MAVLMALAGLAGCDRVTEAAPASAGPARKSGSGELRRDPAPLIKRFPLLGPPQAVQWMSGTLGDARVPGPSTYWIDAVVQLPAEHAAWIQRQFVPQPAAAGEAPDVVAALRPLLPPGPWQRSPALDAALSQQGFMTRAFVSGEQLVLVAVGE